MLACLDRGSRTLDIVRAHGRFGISVLAADQEPIARAFASKAPHTEKFREVASPSTRRSRSSRARPPGWPARCASCTRAAITRSRSATCSTSASAAASRCCLRRRLPGARLSAALLGHREPMLPAPLDQLAPRDCSRVLLGGGAASPDSGWPRCLPCFGHHLPVTDYPARSRGCEGSVKRPGAQNSLPLVPAARRARPKTTSAETAMIPVSRRTIASAKRRWRSAGSESKSSP